MFAAVTEVSAPGVGVTIAESEETFFFPYLASQDSVLAATWMSRGEGTPLRAGFSDLTYLYCSKQPHTLVASSYLPDAPPVLGEADAAGSLQHREPETGEAPNNAVEPTA